MEAGEFKFDSKADEDEYCDAMADAHREVPKGFVMPIAGLCAPSINIPVAPEAKVLSSEEAFDKIMDEGAFDVPKEYIEPGMQTAYEQTEHARRKGVPLYSGAVAYFPLALEALAELSRIGNDQHNPGSPLHWDRSKSSDELDALMRHLTDRAKGQVFDIDSVRHLTKVFWRAGAALQKELEDAAKEED